MGKKSTGAFRSFSLKTKLKFFGLSLLGIFAFFISYEFNGRNSIAVDHLTTLLRTLAGPVAPYAALLMIVYGAARPFILKTWKQSFSSVVFTFFKLLGVVFAIMFLTGWGPEIIHRPDHLPFLFSRLAIVLTFLIPIGAMFLAFLTGWGLMEFVGTLARPLMRWVFKVPGRAAIDAVGSFVGSYAIALLITDNQYRIKNYTKREAAVIATGFSTMSAPFVLVVADTLGLQEKWNMFFWTAMLTTFIVTAITVRLWPLRSMKNEYIDGSAATSAVSPDSSAAPDLSAPSDLLTAAAPAAALTAAVEPSESKRGLIGRLRETFNTAFTRAFAQSEAAGNVFKLMGKTFISGVNITANFVPTILSIGLTGLLLVEYTPIFKIMAYLFLPFTWIIGLEDPLLVAQAISTSLAEVLLPSILATDFSEPARYVVGLVSISSILFFSACIPCIKGTAIPISVSKLVIIWVIRVILSILVAGLFALVLF